MNLAFLGAITGAKFLRDVVMNLAFLGAITGAKFLRVVDIKMDTFHKRLFIQLSITHTSYL
jgi:uncharacterized membrane protein YcjF (UPF0283 family)